MPTKTKSRTSRPKFKTTTVSYSPESEEKFEFTFRRDGTGKCVDAEEKLWGGHVTSVSFEWDPGALDPACDIPEQLEELASELFWDEINDQLEDQVITDAYLSENGEGQTMYESGNEDELEALSRLILHSFPELWADGRDALTASFYAGGEHVEGAQVDPYHLEHELGGLIASEVLGRVQELLVFGLELNEPVGEHLEYNDGAYHRMSGYSWTANAVSFAVERPSFHEIAEARHALRERLAVHMPASDLDRLLAVS